MKRCSQCGAVLPEQASFCPYCTATLIERHEIEMPSRRRRWRIGITAAALICVGTVLVVLLGGARKPEASPEAPNSLQENITAEGTNDFDLYSDGPLTAEGADYPYLCSYEAENGESYRLFLSDTPEDDGEQDLVGTTVRCMTEGAEGDSPITVFVQNKVGKYCAEEFSALMNEYTVEVIGPGADKITFAEPKQSEKEELWIPSGALLYQRMHIRADIEGVYLIRWTLQMKNGDVVILEQTVDLTIQKVALYSWRNTPMNTTEELQALFDSLTDIESEEECHVRIELPAVTYDAPLYCSRQVELCGQNDTVFAGGLTLDGDRYATEITGVTFAGNGGTGITAKTAVYLMNCSFTGWEKAAEALDGGWLHIENCWFVRNGTALRYCTRHANEFGPRISDSLFRENSVAIDVDTIRSQAWLSPTYCTFDGNGENVRNPNGYRVEEISCTYK